MTFKEGCDKCDWNYEYGWIEALRAALMIVISSPDSDSILKALSAKIKSQEEILEELKERDQ